MRNTFHLRSNSGENSPHSKSVRTPVGWLLATLVLAGCAPETAEFSFNERTLSLIPEARRPVEEQLVENFGNPQQLVAWLRFPVDFGRREGSVAAAPDEGVNYRFRAELASLPAGDTNLSGLSLLWTSGIYKDTPVPVRFYDAESGEMTLDVNLEQPPAAGDQFVVVGDVLQTGRKAYMTHCMHCHGVAGDGNGPTAKYLNPLPRDYRQGIFKFKSTQRDAKPSRADLRNTIKRGIPGTYMPSFLLLPDDELDAIVEFVRWLSIRGEFERKLAVSLQIGFSRTALEERRADGTSRDEVLEELKDELSFFPDLIERSVADLAKNWQAAEDEAAAVVPSIARTPDTFESRQRGRNLFLGKDAQCAACHGVSTAGDGPSTREYGEDKTAQRPGLFDDWGHPSQPRDLTKGQYRGGRRPLDIFRRIHQGIPGTKMPLGSKSLKDPQIWDLVNYVMSVPYDGPTPSAEETDEKTAARTNAENR